jgi:hypothetical protein
MKKLTGLLSQSHRLCQRWRPLLSDVRGLRSHQVPYLCLIDKS